MQRLAMFGQGGNHVIFCLGSDWRLAIRSFKRDVSFTKFDDIFVFDEQTDSDSSQKRIEYRDYNITLNGVVDGNAASSDASPEEFNIPDENQKSKAM